MRILTVMLALLMASCATSSKSTKTAAPATPSAESAPATNAKAKHPAGATVTCKAASDVRTIAVADKDGGCEVHYTKQGKDSVISHALHGRKHCEDSAAKIRSHLTGSGYHCE